MRKLVLSMGVSLDGLVARPGRYGAGGWALPPEDAALTQGKLGRRSIRPVAQPTRARRRVPPYPAARRARPRTTPVQDLTAPLRLELVDAQTYPTGGAAHVYRPASHR